MPRPGDCARRLGLPGVMPKKDREPDCSTHYRTSACTERKMRSLRVRMEARSRRSFGMMAPLTAAHLTNDGLLMEAGEDAGAPSRCYGVEVLRATPLRGVASLNKKTGGLPQAPSSTPRTRAASPLPPAPDCRCCR